MRNPLAVLAVAATMAAAPAAAVDNFSSFNGTNDNGGFRYGVADDVTLTAFDTNGGSDIPGSLSLNFSGLGGFPYASTGGTLFPISVPTDAVLLHPGNSYTQSAFVAYIAPATDNYHYIINVQPRGADTSNGIGYTSFTSVGGVVTLGSRRVIQNYLDIGVLNGTIVLDSGDLFGVIIDYNDSNNGDATGIQYSITTVPEPATWGMLLAGFGLIGVAARRRKSALAA